VSIWVSQDARKRGMSARWGIGVGLLLIVFLPLYFLVRRRTVKCAGCGNDIAASLSLCEECEQSIQQDLANARPGRILGEGRAGTHRHSPTHRLHSIEESNHALVPYPELTNNIPPATVVTSGVERTAGRARC